MPMQDHRAERASTVPGRKEASSASEEREELECPPLAVLCWPWPKEAYWSNTLQMVGQVKCKRVVKSAQLPINDAHNPEHITVDLAVVSTLMLWVR